MKKVLIQDVISPHIPAFMRGFGEKAQAKELSTEVIIDELFRRGVGIERIFAQYYALEENATGRQWQYFGTGEEGQHGRPPITVGDAHLAGHDGKPEVNQDKPF